MKNFEFLVHGPFPIPVVNSELDLSQFWRSDDTGPLRRSCGCYVLALQRVKGAYFPQYVGMTRKAFDLEVFNRSNRVKYRKMMDKPERRRWKPVLFLITPSHHKGKVNRSFIRPLERFLIQVGSARNPAIANRKDVHRPKWSIRGVTGRQSGKPTRAARKFRKAMGIA